MLCDTMMNLSQFTLISIFVLFLAEVPEATSWRSKELDRHDGYDLQRGPVFYEAYYPDDQGPAAKDQQRNPINPQTARRYFDRTSVLEKTYQAIEDSRNGFQGERRSRHDRDQLLPDYYKAASIPTESFRNTVQESRNPMDLRADSDQAYEVAQQLKRFVEGLERDPSPRHDLNTGDFADPRSSYNGAIARRTFRTSDPYPQVGYERSFDNEKFLSDRRLDDYVNIILSAVKKEALEISKERLGEMSSRADNKEGNVRISRQERFVESEDSFDRPQPEIMQGDSNTVVRSVKSSSGLPEMVSEDKLPFSDERKYLNHNEQFDSQTFGDEYDDVRGPISKMGFTHMENIFQPRPQVISYVFSPTRTKALSSSSGSNNQPTKTISTRFDDQTLGSYGNNLIENEMRKEVTRSDGLGIASIEVSEMPRHKIRHHHGEKSRRNHQRHTTAKADQ